MTDTTPPVPPVPPPASDGITPPQPNPYAPPAVQADPAQPNPYAQAAPYGAPGYAPRTNTLAIIALVLAFVVPLGGIICGHIALGQIKRTGESGHGLAFAGTVLGYVFTGLSILFLIIYFVVIFAVVANGSYSSYSG